MVSIYKRNCPKCNIEIEYTNKNDEEFVIEELSDWYATRGKSFEVEILQLSNGKYKDFYSMLHKMGNDIKHIKQQLALTNKSIVIRLAGPTC